MKYHHPRFLFRRHEIIRRVQSGKRFLEIGPGNLELAKELLSNFDRGVLIDFNSKDVIEIFDNLPDNFKKRFQLIIQDFTEFKFPQNSFNCVIACEVMEHIEDDEIFLNKIKYLLHAGGQLVLSVPARMRFWSIDDELAGHIRRYEKQELYKKLKESGFCEIEIISYGFPFQNLIRLARISYVQKKRKERMSWNQIERSKESAFLLRQRNYFDFLGLLINKYTILPFAALATLFNHLDLAEGYIAFAKKGKNAQQ